MKIEEPSLWGRLLGGRAKLVAERLRWEPKGGFSEESRNWITEPSANLSIGKIKVSEDDVAVKILSSPRPDGWHSDWLKENIEKVLPRQQIEINLPRGYALDETGRRELERTIRDLVQGKAKIVKERNLESLEAERGLDRIVSRPTV